MVRHARNFGDAQRECVHVEQQLAVLHVAAGRGVRVADHQVTASMLVRVSASFAEHVEPTDVAWIVLIHETDLTKVDRLDADVDVAGREVVEPHARFEPAHVGYGGARSPLVELIAVRVHDGFVNEGPWRRRLAELAQHALGDGDGCHVLGDDFESGGLQDQIRIGLM